MVLLFVTSNISTMIVIKIKNKIVFPTSDKETSSSFRISHFTSERGKHSHLVAIEKKKPIKNFYQETANEIFEEILHYQRIPIGHFFKSKHK